jgi:hypothetical protein
MTSSFVLILVVIFLLPLIPAFLLYKFLPSKTNATGPFKGLNVKLSGAFAGYFILLLFASGIAFPLLKNEQQQKIDELTAELNQLKGKTQEWKMTGSVVSSIPEQTKIFYDEEHVSLASTGDFDVKLYCDVEDGKPKLPKALCFFNKADGYKVININRETNPADLTSFKVSFNDSTHQIFIGSPIDIESKKKDSVRIATALYNDLVLKNAKLPANSKLLQTINENHLNAVRPQ